MTYYLLLYTYYYAKIVLAIFYFVFNSILDKNKEFRLKIKTKKLNCLLENI